MNDINSPRAAIVYLLELEAAAIQYVAENAKHPQSTYHTSLGGRNPGNFKTCQAGLTYSISGYGSLNEIYSGGLRHGNEDVLALLGRILGFAVKTLIPWWMGRFFTMPGENSWHEPCYDRQKLTNKQDGDDDIRRHYNAYGVLRMLADPEMRKRAKITEKEAIEFIDLHFGWVRSMGFSIVNDKREYLRHGHMIDILCGCVLAYEALGKDPTESYLHMTTYVRWIYQSSWATTFEQGGKSFKSWNYGHREFKNRQWTGSFPYGHFEFGLHTWYFTDCMGALIHAAEAGITRGDSDFVDFVKEVFMTSMWPCSSAGRDGAILSDYAARGDLRLRNSPLQGMKWGNASAPHLIREEAGMLLAPDMFFMLADDVEYWRAAAIDNWDFSPGGYFETVYEAPDGSKHNKRHNSEGDPKLAYAVGTPKLETDNWPRMTKALGLFALLTDKQIEKRHAIQVAFDRSAYGNRSDARVEKGKRIDPEKRMDQLNLLNNPFRPWHWWEIGMGGFLDLYTDQFASDFAGSAKLIDDDE